MENIDKIKKALEVIGLDIKIELISEADAPEDYEGKFEGYIIGGVYLYTGLREVSRIGHTDLFPHWIVGYDTIIPGGQWLPDDYEYTEYSSQRCFADSVIDMVSLHIKWKLDNMFEYLAYEETETFYSDTYKQFEIT